jgi:hypothetical protein
MRTRRKFDTGALEDDDRVKVTAGVEADTALEAATERAGIEAGASGEAGPLRETVAGAACAEADADVVAT